MPDKDFTLPPGGFLLYARLNAGPNEESLGTPTPQRCRLVAAGVSRAGVIDNTATLTFSSPSGTIGTLTMATGGENGTEDIEFFSQARATNSFGPTESITVSGDGLGVPQNQPLSIIMIMAPG